MKDTVCPPREVDSPPQRVEHLCSKPSIHPDLGVEDLSVPGSWGYGETRYSKWFSVFSLPLPEISRCTNAQKMCLLRSEIISCNRTLWKFTLSVPLWTTVVKMEENSLSTSGLDDRSTVQQVLPHYLSIHLSILFFTAYPRLCQSCPDIPLPNHLN